jgi:hypothetical protein
MRVFVEQCLAQVNTELPPRKFAGSKLAASSLSLSLPAKKQKQNQRKTSRDRVNGELHKTPVGNADGGLGAFARLAEQDCPVRPHQLCQYTMWLRDSSRGQLIRSAS